MLWSFFLSGEIIEAGNDVQICRIKSFRIFCVRFLTSSLTGQVTKPELLLCKMGKATLTS